MHLEIYLDCPSIKKYSQSSTLILRVIIHLRCLSCRRLQQCKDSTFIVLHLLYYTFVPNKWNCSTWSLTDTGCGMMYQLLHFFNSVNKSLSQRLGVGDCVVWCNSWKHAPDMIHLSIRYTISSCVTNQIKSQLWTLMSLDINKK